MSIRSWCHGKESRIISSPIIPVVQMETNFYLACRGSIGEFSGLQLWRTKNKILIVITSLDHQYARDRRADGRSIAIPGKYQIIPLPCQVQAQRRLLGYRKRSRRR